MAQFSGRPVSKVPLERKDDGGLRFHGCSRIQEYEFLGKLGEGTFGEVSKARSKRSGAVVALKKILMHNEKDGFPITALREIKLLKQLGHVNILKLDEMAVERTRDPKKKPSMFMVTPYMEHDLSGLLENPSVHFTEPQIKCYLMQLLRGCGYLHENKILHRDMKAANLLINNRGVLQIADFGLARPYDDEPPKAGQGGGEATRDYTCLVVTRWYRPPELLLQLRRYTTAIDMWGVGCVFGEMFKGRPILAGFSDLNQAHQIFDLVGSPNDDNMPGWSDLPGCEGVKDFDFRRGNLAAVFREQGSLAISLLGELLKLDWRKRINAMDALKHPYFHSPPLPAKPGDLPRFEDSHELDRRKFRDQKQALPPAPAGGSVGMGPNGQWGENGRPLPVTQRGRGPPPYQNGQGHHHRSRSRPRPRPYQGHRHDGEPQRPPPLHAHSNIALPAKPPPAHDQNGGFRNHNNHRFGGEPTFHGPPRNDARGPGGLGSIDHRRDRPGAVNAHGGDGRRTVDGTIVDTYIPDYSTAPDRPPLRRDGSNPGGLPRDAIVSGRDEIPPPPPPQSQPQLPPPPPPPAAPPSRETYAPLREQHRHHLPPNNDIVPPPPPFHHKHNDYPHPPRQPPPPPALAQREANHHRRDGRPYPHAHPPHPHERGGRYEDARGPMMGGNGATGSYERRRSRSPRGGRDRDRPPPVRERDRERDWERERDRERERERERGPQLKEDRYG